MVGIGERYRHFKGGDYEVIEVGLDSECLNRVVVYRGEDAKVWVRDYDNFIGFKVFEDGRKIKRFEKVGEAQGKIRVKVKRLDGNVVLPRYLLEGDAGMDVVATSKRIEGGFIEYGTGLAFEVPKKYVMLVFPRSSVSKKDLIFANSVGVLDSGYRGELFLRFKCFGDNHYEVGDRIAQVMILPYPEVKFEEIGELGDSVRREGCFGSTGE